jgi:hypothetical protein
MHLTANSGFRAQQGSAIKEAGVVIMGPSLLVKDFWREPPFSVPPSLRTVVMWEAS